MRLLVQNERFWIRARRATESIPVAEPLESRRLLSFAPSFPNGGSMTVREDVNTAPALPEGNLDNEGESLIVINPTNPRNVVAFAVDFVGTDVIDGNAWYSFDGGMTFDESDILHPSDPSEHSGGLDPAAAFDRQGNLYYVHITTTESPSARYVSVAKSTTGGASWSLATVAVTDSGADKCWITVGPNPENLSEDIVYVLYRTGSVTHCIRSLDGGVEFDDDVVVPVGHFPTLVAQPDGRLLAVGQKQIAGTPISQEIRLSYSDDGGLTWADDQLVGTSPVDRPLLGRPLAQPDRGIYPVPSVAVAQAGEYAGRVYVSYTSAQSQTHWGNSDTDITVAYSDDLASEDWESEIVHSTSGSSAGKSQFFSWVSADPMTGVPFVSWLDCRNDSNNKKVERFGTASLTGGVSWLPEVKIADEQSDQSEDNQNAFDFNYGDYIANSAFGGMSYDAWPDNSDSTENNVDGTDALDIYTDRTILSGHLITFTGTSGNDTYVVDVDTSETIVKVWENTSTSNPPTFMMHKDALAGTGAGLKFELGNGNDTITFDEDVEVNATVIGGAGTDSITTGGGNDWIDGGTGVDTLIPGEGDDTIDYHDFSSAVTINLAEGPFGPNGEQDSVPDPNDFENAIGGAGNDLITGYTTANFLDGGIGNDTIDGDDSGTSLLPGTDGYDSILGGEGNDSILGDGGDDTIDGQAGNDTIFGGPGHDSIFGGDNNDSLYGENGNDTITGGSGTDRLDGGANDDRFFAYDSAIDTLFGGSGSDTATIDALADGIPLNDIESIIFGP